MRATDQTPERLPLSAKPTLRRSSGDTSEPVQSTDLLQGRKSVVIEHNGSIYRLQATKLGKLILTK